MALFAFVAFASVALAYGALAYGALAYGALAVRSIDMSCLTIDVDDVSHACTRYHPVSHGTREDVEGDRARPRIMV
jgi:hypothetical protein